MPQERRSNIIFQSIIMSCNYNVFIYWTNYKPKSVLIAMPISGYQPQNIDNRIECEKCIVLHHEFARSINLTSRRTQTVRQEWQWHRAAARFEFHCRWPFKKRQRKYVKDWRRRLPMRWFEARINNSLKRTLYVCVCVSVCAWLCCARSHKSTQTLGRLNAFPQRAARGWIFYKGLGLLSTCCNIQSKHCGVHLRLWVSHKV